MTVTSVAALITLASDELLWLRDAKTDKFVATESLSTKSTVYISLSQTACKLVYHCD